MITYLRTQQSYEMQLSPLEPEDLELLYEIENSPEMWDVTSSNVPYSRYVLKDYIANQQNDIYADKQIRFVIRVEGAAIGLIDLFNFEPRHQRAELGLAILKEHRGKGFSAQAIGLLKEYAQKVINLHQIYCIVPENNKPSLRMLRSEGFCNEFILKDWIQTSDGWQNAVFTSWGC